MNYEHQEEVITTAKDLFDKREPFRPLTTNMVRLPEYIAFTPEDATFEALVLQGHDPESTQVENIADILKARYKNIGYAATSRLTRLQEINIFRHSNVDQQG